MKKAIKWIIGIIIFSVCFAATVYVLIEKSKNRYITVMGETENDLLTEE